MFWLTLKGIVCVYLCVCYSLTLCFAILSFFLTINKREKSAQKNNVTVFSFIYTFFIYVCTRCNTWTLKNKCISNVGRSISLGSNPGLPIRHCTSATPGLRYKNLGKSGLRISNVGLGTWSIFAPSVSEEQAETIIKLAVDSGINIFDLSEAHSGKHYFFVRVFPINHQFLCSLGIRAEIELGKILQKYQWKRASYVVTTKIYWSTK